MGKDYVILKNQNQLYESFSFNLRTFILNYPAMMKLFSQLCSNNDTMQENIF